ncbi:hypothetical protein MAM1_0047c03215 [Mucor ambiguus]|uniref:Uncharacterized protein n=1 Tax=Mucor ambiguus TaxID=91626 RepID=A0A0C9LTJ0_9FUNG|nr:hypothetical protein MAM1_0047c03215 [Mucor ambiguus]
MGSLNKVKVSPQNGLRSPLLCETKSLCLPVVVCMDGREYLYGMMASADLSTDRHGVAMTSSCAVDWRIQLDVIAMYALGTQASILGMVDGACLIYLAVENRGGYQVMLKELRITRDRPGQKQSFLERTKENRLA